MKKIFTILILSSLFAGELEVEGNLTVTGDIDSPTIDALSGMKPERIYRYVKPEDQSFSIVVPEGKIWSITGFADGTVYIEINNNLYVIGTGDSQKTVFAIQGDIITDYTSFSSYIMLNIFEYSISGSGTDQGMDYIEP